jgi:hypothetical protein
MYPNAARGEAFASFDGDQPDELKSNNHNMGI